MEKAGPGRSEPGADRVVDAVGWENQELSYENGTGVVSILCRGCEERHTSCDHPPPQALRPEQPYVVFLRSLAVLVEMQPGTFAGHEMSSAGQSSDAACNMAIKLSWIVYLKP